MAQKEAFEKAHTKLRSKFHRLLMNYRQDENAQIKVKHMKPVMCPYNENPPPTKEEIEIMESCPKADIENLEELLEEENLSLYIPSLEDGETYPKFRPVVNYEDDDDEEVNPAYKEWTDEEGTTYTTYVENAQEGEYWLTKARVSVLILKLKLKESETQRKRPAVVFLHGINKDKESLRPLLKAYASRGYVAISVDTSHHGERAVTTDSFKDIKTNLHKQTCLGTRITKPTTYEELAPFTKPQTTPPKDTFTYPDSKKPATWLQHRLEDFLSGKSNILFRSDE
ncbi:hypothetical protein ACSQ67_018884 [Phaseolus vulgaris]